MASDETVQKLNSAVTQISNLDVAKLVSNVDWGSINFKGSADDIRDIVTMVKPLGSLPVRIIPDGFANEIERKLIEFLGIVKRIDQFKLGDNSESERNAINQQIKNSVKEVYQAIHPHAAYLALYAGDLDKTVQSLEQTRATTMAQVETFTKYMDDSRTEVSGILASAREAAGNAGVGTFSADFAIQADSQETQAKGWLTTTAILAILSLVVAVASYFMPVDKLATTPQIIQLVTSKLVVLGLLLSATFWSSRQYRALKHQIAVNRHRSIALKTFQAFVQASSEGTTRDAVLLETTRSIFALAPSGYLSNQNDSTGQDGLKIVEMFRGTSLPD